MNKSRNPDCWSQSGFCVSGSKLWEAALINFSGGDWIVEALKLLERSPVLRRMFYIALIVIGGFAVAKSLPGIAEIIKALNA
ncbi:hypothetical protein FQE80_26475 [Escherichia coli]|nr:hypothetical protein [Escherichia coli O21]EGO7676560.1 hypothetical protein [Escherichia coli]EGO7714780.1 hypothetical protein [Escherichia coli]